MARSKAIVLWTTLVTAWLCNSYAGEAASWSDVNLTKNSGATVTTNPLDYSGAGCYIRSDGVASVVYQASDLDIHEMTLVGGKWADYDLTKYSKATVSPNIFGAGPMGYVRGDKVSAVVYTGGDGHIHEMALVGGKWADHDLTVASKATGGTSFMYLGQGPNGYVRSDGVNSVVYQADDYDIHEMALVGGTWADYDLTKYSKATVDGWYYGAGPMGYVRGDKVSAVVYTGWDGHIHEMTLVGGKWADADLTVYSKTKVTIGYSPEGYVRSDGVSSVVYRAEDNHVHEIALAGGKWADYDLTVYSGAKVTIGLGGPKGYVRSDGVSSVVYAGSDGHIHELGRVRFASLGGKLWFDDDLTVASKAYHPYGYIPRGCVHGGISAVVYDNIDGIHEMELK